MPPQTPMLLVDNVFDTVTLYPNATLTVSNERTGYEAYRVADYRRERTSWQGASSSASHFLTVDVGAGVTATVDTLWLDRGHNLWGRSLAVTYWNGVGFATHATLTVPASGTLGGDPTTSTMCVTEEGACYAFMTLSSARQIWSLNLSGAAFIPIVPGIILGRRVQLLGYSTSFDEDASERTEVTAVSQAGYRAVDTTYAWRKLDLGLTQIGSTEYDGTIRGLHATMFRKNQPAFVVMDYGTRPERGWLYQYDGRAWSAPKRRVLREIRLPLREVGASLV